MLFRSKNPKVIAVQTFIKNTLELLLYGAFFVCAINMVPVSYTHLDVYKRQEQSRAEQSSK